MLDQGRRGVEVIEAYRAWSPPPGVVKSVESLLRSIPDEYVLGLRKVVLSNTAALTGKRKRRKWKSSRGKFRSDEILGLYHPSRGNGDAWIELFVDNILGGQSRWLVKLPMIREGMLAKTLFHELGHHIHSTRRPEHRDREDVADRWILRLSRLHAGRKYRYLRPAARLVVKVRRAMRRR